MNGQQRLALSRQQCILFLQKQGLTAAEQMASGMCFVVCCLIYTVWYIYICQIRQILHIYLFFFFSFHGYSFFFFVENDISHSNG